MRTLIDIPERALAALGALCTHRKMSRAEAVRQAIANYIALHKPEPGDAFGLWKGRGRQNGLAYQRKVRAEW